MTTSVSSSVLAGLVLSLLAVPAPYTAIGGTGRPTPKVIPLTSSGKDITPVLTGPPETVTMKSGFVVLPPGKSVGKHSTEQNEELLVVFEGQGEMIFKDGSKLAVKRIPLSTARHKRSTTSPTPGTTTCVTCT
ncbi:MAG: hypothetical protein WCF22_14935 [Candidatus Sulfotelmatobacter sp.]